MHSCQITVAHSGVWQLVISKNQNQRISIVLLTYFYMFIVHYISIRLAIKVPQRLQEDLIAFVDRGKRPC